MPDRRSVLLEAADRVVQREGPDASMNLIAAEAGTHLPGSRRNAARAKPSVRENIYREPKPN